MTIDPATALAFSMHENKGVYAVLLGSGVSHAAQVPTGWEITLDLVRRVAALEGVEDQPDWAAWHQGRFNTPADYSALLDRLASTPAERRSVVHRYIEPTAEDREAGRKTPTRAHHAIAALVKDGMIRVIITTNFDRLMENALREVGVEPTIIKSEDDLAGAVPLVHSRCVVLKVHGDYLDSRLLNTDDELAVYGEGQNRFLDRVLDEHGLVVCGWSADWDPALRAAIARTPSRRFPTFWASRGAPSALALDLIRQRGARVVEIEDADSFFTELQARLETLSRTARPHPLSADLLVGTAKRYLARTEFRIDLADLVTAELGRARRSIEGQGLGPNGPVDTQTFAARLSAYETVYEPLMRTAFIMGRWGLGDERGLVADLVQTLARPPVQNGTVLWLRLMVYPAVLVFTAYALGLTQAGRLEALHQWLSAPLPRARRDDEEPAFEVLFGEMWDGADRDTWNMLDPTANRWTPFNDHLVALFQRTLTAEFLGETEIELAFEWLEILVGVEMTASRTNKAGLEATLQGGQGRGRDYLWSAIGRAAWNSENQERLLNRLTATPTATALVNAGFAKSDSKFLELMAQNFRKVMANQRWR